MSGRGIESASLRVVLLAAALSRPALLAAQETPDADSGDRAVREKWQATYREIARSIDMHRGGTLLTMLGTPLLSYTNPVRTNDQHGAVFLWTEAGRPAVIGSIWSATNRQDRTVRFVTHEWHSLATDGQVRATRADQPLWACDEPGIRWEAVSGEPAPTISRPARLVQMRAIARRYTASIQTEEESDLRLMAQPLFRYGEEVPGVVDGAIFAFAMTTDPELLLMVEDRMAGGKPAWHVTFARFGNKGMTVKEGERVVWSCQPGRPGFSDGKYYLRWRAEEMPAEPRPNTKAEP